MKGCSACEYNSTLWKLNKLWLINRDVPFNKIHLAKAFWRHMASSVANESLSKMTSIHIGLVPLYFVDKT